MDQRLQKLLSERGVASRRKAEELISKGLVKVNGKVAKASLNVKEGDIIEIQFGTKTVKVRVKAIAQTTKKDEAAELFEYL